MVVLSGEDERAYKSFRNISGVDIVLVPELTPTTCCARTGWCSRGRRSRATARGVRRPPSRRSRLRDRSRELRNRPTEPGPEAGAVDEPAASAATGAGSAAGKVETTATTEATEDQGPAGGRRGNGSYRGAGRWMTPGTSSSGR